MGTIAGLQTTVVNNSPYTRTFGFLPPHGQLLGPYEKYTFTGGLDRLYRNPNGTENRRKRLSVENAITNGLMAVVETPTQVFNDATTGAVKVSALNNGTFAESNPSWGAYETILTGAFASISSPQSGGVSSATITFSAAVTGFTSYTQIVLTQNGTPVTLSSANNPTTSDNTTFTIPGLSTLTNTASAAYVLKVPHASSGIADVYGNALSADASVNWSHS